MSTATSPPSTCTFLTALAADEILAGVGIDQRAQARLDVGLGDGHRCSVGMGRDVEKTVDFSEQRPLSIFGAGALLES